MYQSQSISKQTHVRYTNSTHNVRIHLVFFKILSKRTHAYFDKVLYTNTHIIYTYKIYARGYTHTHTHTYTKYSCIDVE